MKQTCTVHTKLGIFDIVAQQHAVTEVSLLQTELNNKTDTSDQSIMVDDHLEDASLLREAADQLLEYLDGKRTVFTVPLRPDGTEFQKKVWAELTKIPYGETRSYQDIAIGIQKPKACQAVGQANNKNPIIIMIPCHRVIGKDGSLVGYGCGNDVKQYLLNLEQHS